MSADRYLSVTTAARWLNARGVAVHVNTVRAWAKAGVVCTRAEPAGRYIHYRVAVSSLEKIAACPCCANHRGNLQSAAHSTVNL